MRILLSGLLLFAPLLASAADPVRIQLGVEPKTLDPVQVIDAAGTLLMLNVVEPLVRIDLAGNVIPGLARDYTVSKDGLTYTFRIREDAKWSDGRPVSAEDFRRGILRTLTAKTAAQDPEALFAIQNAKEFYEGKKAREEVSVRAGGRVLTIRLAAPQTVFLMQLAWPAAGPWREDFPEVWNPALPSTGPYVVQSQNSKEGRIELAPNPEHRKPGPLPVVYQIVSEEAAALNLFEAGKVDVLTTFPPGEARRLEKKGLIKSVRSPFVQYLAFNVKKAPFDDVQWRQAVAGAVDRDGLKAVLPAGFVVAGGFLPSMLSGHTEVPRGKFSGAVAWAKGLKTKPKIRIAYAQSAAAEIILQKVQNDIKKQIGADVELEPMEWKFFLSRLKTDPPPVYFISFGTMYNDPINHLRVFVLDPQSGGNFSRYSNPRFEELVRQIAAAPNGPKRIELIRRSQVLLQEEDTVVVPLAERAHMFAVSPRLENVKINPFLGLDIQSLRKPPDLKR